ncbi:MAG: ABC transporter substrate-binding protein, partial [Thermomicrobiales bacterium]
FALLATLLMLAGVATPALGAQEASPVAGVSPVAGAASRSITRAEFEEQLRQAFAIEEPAARGGTVILGNPSDISTLNGMLANNATTFYITGLIFESLVVSSPIDGQPAPGLADWWELAADGVTYTFHLNQDATWHDGVDLTAADVIFTLDAQRNPDTTSPYGGTITAIVASYRALDDDTVEIVSNGPSATFLLELFLPIMPKHIWESVGFAAWASDPGSTGVDPARVVGAGPFVFQEWVQGDHVTLARNPDYYGTVPTIDEFILRVLPDETAAVQALEAGDVDMMAAVPPTEVERLDGSDALDVAVFDTFEFDFYLYNLDPARTTLFQDARVRRALYRALDRDAIDQSIYFGLGEPAVGPQPVLSIAYAPDRMETDNSFDPEAAKALLADAGWADSDGDGVLDKDGESFTFELLTYTGDQKVQRTATYMQQAWAEIGVEMTPVLMDLSTLIETMAGQRDFEMAMLGLSWDATASQGSMFACGGDFNVMAYCNPRYDELNEQQRYELDEARRIELLIEQSNIIWAEMPVGIIQFIQGSTCYGTHLRNLHPNAYSLLWSLPYVWVEG